MNDYPNIFDYATKEFTQDAMICWLLNCKETCLPFLKKFIFRNNDEIKGEIEFEYGPSKQISRIDVYANIECNGKYYPIIFENKANTTTHDEQIKRYCELVYEWYKEKSELDTVYFVYFKTGYMFDKEKKLVEKEFDEINHKEKFCTKPIFISAENMKNFISKYKNHYKILEDYYLYLENLIEKQKNILIIGMNWIVCQRILVREDSFRKFLVMKLTGQRETVVLLNTVIKILLDILTIIKMYTLEFYTVLSHAGKEKIKKVRNLNLSQYLIFSFSFTEIIKFVIRIMYGMKM